MGEPECGQWLSLNVSLIASKKKGEQVGGCLAEAPMIVHLPENSQGKSAEMFGWEFRKKGSMPPHKPRLG